jgi:integrase
LDLAFSNYLRLAWSDADLRASTLRIRQGWGRLRHAWNASPERLLKASRRLAAELLKRCGYLAKRSGQILWRRLTCPRSAAGGHTLWVGSDAPQSPANPEGAATGRATLTLARSWRRPRETNRASTEIPHRKRPSPQFRYATA